MVINEKNRFRFVLIAIMLFVSFFAVAFFLPLQKVFAAGIAANDFDKTDVMADLESSTVGGKAFNVSEYPKDLTGICKTSIINFVEYCYNYRPHLQHNYGLYVYIYNPKEIVIDTKAVGNKIQLAVGYDKDGAPNEYEKFDLKFCSKSEDTYKNRFYKFRIVDCVSLRDNLKIVDRVSRDCRRYDISGIELVTYGERNATEYKVAGTYKFTGYVAGYGADVEAESDLKSTVNELETIELDVKHTYYRTGVSSLGKGHQNQIDTVYFSVDNSILEKYGKLQKIKAEWYEYKTAPIVITNKIDIYNQFLPYVGKKIKDYDSNVPVYMFDKQELQSASSSNYDYGWIYNVKIRVLDTFESRCNFLPYWFYAESDDLAEYTLSGKDLYKYIERYDKSNYNGYLPIKTNKLNADLFLDTVDSGRKRGYNLAEIDTNNTFDLLSYNDTNSWWTRLSDYGFWSPNLDDSYKDVRPIYPVFDKDFSVTDIETSRNLLVNMNDVGSVEDYYNFSKADNKTMFLFRFAVTDYYSSKLFIRNDNFSVVFGKDGMIAQETVFFDFDILQLTFNRDGVYHVIPVVSSPIDIVNDVTPPLKNNTFNWLALLITLLILLVVFIIFSPFIMPVLLVIFKVIVVIFAAVIWVICLPFRLIARLFRLKKSEKSDK